MKFTATGLAPATIVDLEPRQDERGFFARMFCAEEFAAHGLNRAFVQGNTSYTRLKNTLRGMHYQVDGAEESKLVRCTRGAILDVIIDVRPASPTYRQHVSVELSQDNHRQLYVPEGFAHGFITLTDDVEVSYLVSAFYAPGKECGIRWNDPTFSIAWPTDAPNLSDKDASHPDYVVKTER